MRHPTQPLALDEKGVLRFQKNQIVSDLLEHASKHGMDLNTIACGSYSEEDHRQLAQLIGYSLSGYGGLSYVDDVSYMVAEEVSRAGGKDEKDLRIEFLESRLSDFKTAIREPIAALFEVHPSDLGAED